jgi:SOS-response transcriptional repressor LexA
MESATSAAPVNAGSANDIVLPGRNGKRTPQQVVRDDRLTKMLRALERAANAGVPCPSNEDLSRTLGYASPSKASDLIATLETIGFITVERGSDTRVVTIVKTGKGTAGDIRKRRQKGGWTDDQEAILMDGMAQGLTFAAIGKILGKSKNACVGRFHMLSASMGHQAA